MAQNSRIEWTESTWNPVTGCTKISTGCKNCYAERMAKRLHAMRNNNYRNGFRTTMHPHVLEYPLKWKQSRTIFVNSMSDLFHRNVTTEFILQIFDVMQRASQHRFQVLTKRPERLLSLSQQLPWPENVWMGVTVETADYTYRIDHLRQTPAAVKFLSIEPLLGPIGNLNLDGINWVIVGGESGPGARPIERSWVTDIRDQCVGAKIPFFFKQWGGVNKKKNGRALEGKIYSQMPINIEGENSINVQFRAPQRRRIANS